jgi:hypothetical protein
MVSTAPQLGISRASDNREHARIETRRQLVSNCGATCYTYLSDGRRRHSRPPSDFPPQYQLLRVSTAPAICIYRLAACKSAGGGENRYRRGTGNQSNPSSPRQIRERRRGLLPPRTPWSTPGRPCRKPICGGGEPALSRAGTAPKPPLGHRGPTALPWRHESGHLEIRSAGRRAPSAAARGAS